MDAPARADLATRFDAKRGRDLSKWRLPEPPAGTTQEVRESFQAHYLALLNTPEVRRNVGRILRSKSTKDIVEMLRVLLPSLVPSGGGGASSAPRITLVNKLGTGAKTVDITPKAP